ncbi:Recombination protein RecR [hydrothermal vent metagenome]|uniref:Recombination protein RecR n=1 Tax=hydrothermal vent metagenome TaxID=652676 RepID=A0A3B0RR96_9ZZZZ
MPHTSAGPEIEQLITLLSRLPGLGPRSARRAVLHLIRKKEGLLAPLGRAMMNASERIVSCKLCGNIDVKNPCAICTSVGRDHRAICVVEQVGDLWALERAGAHRGRYFVLGGVLSAIDGVRPEDLHIERLITQAGDPKVSEVILALNATVDGAATAHFLSDRLQVAKVKITSIARGVPVGGELDYLDDGTLAAALHARKDV